MLLFITMTVQDNETVIYLKRPTYKMCNNSIDTAS